jgi:serine/threonine-protein kinase
VKSDRRVDIYAFGVVLWEMLARRSLFTGTAISILTRIANEEIPPVRGVRPDVSPALEAIALKACRRDPEKRYATAEEMRLDLEAYVRERNDGISERDVAQVMNRMFADIRDDVRTRIKAYIATMPAQPALLHTSPGITSTGRLPVLPSWSGPSSTPSLPAPTASEFDTQTAPARAPRRLRWPLAVIALLLAAAGLVFLTLRTPPSGPVGETPSTSPPSLNPTALPSPSAPSAHAVPVTATAAQPEKSAAAADAPAAATSAAAANRHGASPAAAPSAHPAHVHGAPAPAPAAAPGPSAPGTSPSPAPSPSAPERPNIRMLDDSKP